MSKEFGNNWESFLLCSSPGGFKIFNHVNAVGFRGITDAIVKYEYKFTDLFTSHDKMKLNGPQTDI